MISESTSLLGGKAAVLTDEVSEAEVAKESRVSEAGGRERRDGGTRTNEVRTKSEASSFNRSFLSSGEASEKRGDEQSRKPISHEIARPVRELGKRDGKGESSSREEREPTHQQYPTSNPTKFVSSSSGREKTLSCSLRSEACRRRRRESGRIQEGPVVSR